MMTFPFTFWRFDMWIRVRVTGGFVGPAGWEDHNIDLDKLPADRKAELVKLIAAAKLDQGPVASPPPPAKDLPDTKCFSIKVKGPKGEADVTAVQANITPELMAVVNATRKLSTPPK